MTQIAEVLSVGLGLAVYGGAVPEDVAGFSRSQTADHAQQAGFTDAVGPRHIQPVASFQMAIDVFEELPSTPGTSKLGKSQ